MNKAQAFHEQAQSDYRVFELLLAQDRREVPECHPLHYLQMATEKLAKAFMMAEDEGYEKFTHVVLSDLPQKLQRKDVAHALGWTRWSSYTGFLNWLKPVLSRIEALNPAVGTAPNVEYPWRGRDSGGEMVWLPPSRHDFALIEELYRSHSGISVRQFFRLLLERFDAIAGQ